MRELLQLAIFETSGPLSMLFVLGGLLAGAGILAIVSWRDSRSPLLTTGMFAAASVACLVALAFSLASLLPFETSVAKVLLFIRPWLPVVGGLGIAAVIIGVSFWLRRPATLAAPVFFLLTVLVATVLLWSRFAELQESVVKHLISVPESHQFASDTPTVIESEDATEVLVPAGPFIQGSLSPLQMQVIVGNVEGDEKPVRSSYLDAYYIDRYEVTNDQFEVFVEATDYVTDAETITKGRRWGADGWVSTEDLTWREPMFLGDEIDGRGDHPVVQVSWNDAVAYCAWAGKRLPTDAEWEKAARGQRGFDFPWGHEFDGSMVNFCDTNCSDLPQHKDDSADDGYTRTAPVGSYPGGMSPYGAYDMAGNVWEWVQDAYDPYYYHYAPEFNPAGPILSDVTHRIVRGGSFTSEVGYVRTTSKSYDPPATAYFGVGFRCARDAN